MEHIWTWGVGSWSGMCIMYGLFVWRIHSKQVAIFFKSIHSVISDSDSE